MQGPLSRHRGLIDDHVRVEASTGDVIVDADDTKARLSHDRIDCRIESAVTVDRYPIRASLRSPVGKASGSIGCTRLVAAVYPLVQNLRRGKTPSITGSPVDVQTTAAHRRRSTPVRARRSPSDRGRHGPPVGPRSSKGCVMTSSVSPLFRRQDRPTVSQVVPHGVQTKVVGADKEWWIVDSRRNT